MRAGATIGVLIFLAMLASTQVRAQVNLPPPPPPPLSTESPQQQPPPSDGSGGASGTGSARTRGKPPPPRRGGERGGERDRDRDRGGERGERGQGTIGTSDQPIAPAASRKLDLSLRLNPLPLFEGRASADGELMFAPHHAVIASPHVTFSAPRFTLAAKAFGFAPQGAGGVGTEVGYHYWIEPRLEGLWLGPSVLFGVTSPPDKGKAFGYYGAAFDVGWQLVVNPGFTVMFGAGLLVIDATPAGAAWAVAPRGLLGVGWTF